MEISVAEAEEEVVVVEAVVEGVEAEAEAHGMTDVTTMKEASPSIPFNLELISGMY